MFQAHINVEYCNSVKSIKYVCKYINKGSDMAVFEITSKNNERQSKDEILQYQMGRYINSNEAAWRILGFPIHDRDPTVVHLAVHLENGQRVYFTRETAERVGTEPPKNTTLTAFFEPCKTDPFARTLFYVNVPSYYTFNAGRRIFERRKVGTPVEGFQGIFKCKALGRVYTVHPKNAECFYLRMLLHEKRGPTSFSDLKQIHGYVCETYREACQRLGLLENDNQWELALQEAAQSSTAEKVRDLFAIILTMCSPSNPNSLWEKFKENMSDDILYQMQQRNPELNIQFTEEIFNQALICVEDKCLKMTNQFLLELGMNAPRRDRIDELSSEILKEKNYNTNELLQYIAQNKPLLIDSQQYAYDFIMNYVNKSIGGVIFLDAPGGTGKTFLINLILAELRAKKEIALALASSGIAATLMEGGRTAHSALKLPLNVPEQEFPVCNISKASGRGQLLKECKVIIWDECTMAHKKSFEALDRTLQDLRGNSELMGGVLVILSGDFRQTLPVIPKSTAADEINACLKKSLLWSQVKKVSLTANMRVQLYNSEKARLFAKKLLQIGEGTHPVDNITGQIKLANDFCVIVNSPDELIEKVYPNITENYIDSNWLHQRTILAVRNEIVDDINLKIQKKIPGQEKIYKSIDSMIDTNETVNYPTEFLNSMQVPGMPLHCLNLKIGSPIILLRNLDPPRLCNGTRMTVKQLLNNTIEAKIMSGKDKGQTVFIPRIPLISTQLPFQFKRVQFPVKLAFSITINKAQGQTMKYCGINLEESCFSHGQLYVSCSRVGNPENLFIYSPDKQMKNVVYKQVL